MLVITGRSKESFESQRSVEWSWEGGGGVQIYPKFVKGKGGAAAAPQYFLYCSRNHNAAADCREAAVSGWLERRCFGVPKP